MKRTFVLFLFFAVSLSQTATAQNIIWPYKTTPQDYTFKTLVDGVMIQGVPFMDYKWRPGTLLMKDGRTYDQYQLKYDTYHQTVLFLNGKDSLEVADPIKEFVIEDNKGNVHHFINANEYKKQSKPLYYEILLEDTRGHLLKAHHTITVSVDDILNTKDNKRLKSVYDYFYYDRASGKVTQVRLSPAGVKSALKLTDQQQNDLFFPGYVFNEEEDLFKFFRVYLKS